MFCSANRSPEIPESAFIEISDVVSAHRSPRIPESVVFEISDVVFCAQESWIF